MSNDFILYLMGGATGFLVIIIVLYFFLAKKMQKSEYKKIQKLQQGTKASSFSTEVLFQKLYLTYVKIPFIKRYILKVRRKLEIINIDDEYKTRKDSAKIISKALEKIKMEYQILIYLRDIQGFNYKEICKILDKTMPQVKISIYRARKSLEKVLRKEGEVC